MSDYACYLITVIYGNDLMRAALRIPNAKLTLDERTYPMEYREKFHEFLPLHVRSCGPVVEIEEIFEVSEVSK